MDSLKTISKTEKAHFLSMDLIERMIRVEQSVSASFNKIISYKETGYYASLSPELKKEFDNYLKNKKTKKRFFIFSILGSFILISLFNSSLTGNVISENFGSDVSNYFGFFLLVILVIALAVGLFSYFSNKFTEKKFREKSQIIDDFIARKSLIGKGNIFKLKRYH